MFCLKNAAPTFWKSESLLIMDISSLQMQGLLYFLNSATSVHNTWWDINRTTCNDVSIQNEDSSLRLLHRLQKKMCYYTNTASRIPSVFQGNPTDIFSSPSVAHFLLNGLIVSSWKMFSFHVPWVRWIIRGYFLTVYYFSIRAFKKYILPCAYDNEICTIISPHLFQKISAAFSI